MVLSFRISIGLIFLMLGFYAYYHGPWIDEFWTMHLSDTSIRPTRLFHEYWMKDPHPPEFSFFVMLLRPIIGDSIIGGRFIVNGIFSVILMAGTILFSRTHAERRGFYFTTVLLALSLLGNGGAVDAASNFRSYYAQITTSILLIFTIHHALTSAYDINFRRRPHSFIIFLILISTSLQLHYITSFINGVVTLGAIILTYRRGHRQWAALFAIALLLSGILLSLSLHAQLAYLHDSAALDWITDRKKPGWTYVLIALSLCLAHNPPAIIGCFFNRRNNSECKFVALLLSSVTIALFILILIDTYKTTIVDRYLIGSNVILCAAIAAKLGDWTNDRKHMAWISAFAVASVAIQIAISPPTAEWKENAEKIQKIVSICPSTKIYAANGYALTNKTINLGATHEQPVFSRGYRMLAQEYNFPVIFIPMGKVINDTPGRCPILLWIEHRNTSRHITAATVLHAAGLSLPAETETQLYWRRNSLLVIARAQISGAAG